MSIYIIEGIDRIGKSTLVSNIMKNNGFHNVVHYERPMKSPFYNNSLYDYQYASFVSGFELIKNASHLTNIIFDRFHLGEYVYAPLYRGYDGNYVFTDLEQTYKNSLDDVKLILLITHDLDIISDDGESFDYAARGDEQQAFVDAFYNSSIKDKRIIHTTYNGEWIDPNDIYEAAVSRPMSEFDDILYSNVNKSQSVTFAI